MTAYKQTIILLLVAIICSADASTRAKPLRPAFIPDSGKLSSTQTQKEERNACRLTGDITIPAPVEDVWEVLSDYDHASEYLPSLTASRIQSTISGRPGQGSFRGHVHQKGVSRISLGRNLDYSDIVLDVAESFQNGARTLRFRLVENLVLSACHGSWTIRSNASGDTVLHYEATIAPKFPIPAAVVRAALRSDIPKNLAAIRAAAMQRAARLHH